MTALANASEPTEDSDQCSGLAMFGLTDISSAIGHENDHVSAIVDVALR